MHFILIYLIVLLSYNQLGHVYLEFFIILDTYTRLKWYGNWKGMEQPGCDNLTGPSQKFVYLFEFSHNGDTVFTENS